MSNKILEQAIDAASRLRADLVKSKCRSEEDLIVVAVAMMQQAEIIYKEIGGSRLAAAQFYAAADRMASDAAS